MGFDVMAERTVVVREGGGSGPIYPLSLVILIRKCCSHFLSDMYRP